MQAIWKKKEKLSPLGNEASLNFVSLRSHFNSVGRRGLSRVEMNALRAPLTALYVSAEMEIFFSLDTADAFIDGRLIITDSCGVYAWIEPCGQRRVVAGSNCRSIGGPKWPIASV